MGLKCSLLGHDYGDVEVERSREEQGNEVVETVREVKQCERCGAEQIVSENTEVRSAVDPADVGLDAESPAGPAERSVGDADADDLEPAVTRVGDAGSAGGVGVETDESFDAPSPAEDDAVILDDDGDEDAGDATAGRDPGEWPGADDTRQEERDVGPAAEAEAGDDAAEVVGEDDGEGSAPQSAGGDAGADAWPETEGEDEGFGAEPAGDTDAGVQFGGGLTPDPDETATDAGAEAAEEEDAEIVESAGTGVASAGSADRSGDRDVVGTSLVCPECGYAAALSGSSLRAGDICPECHEGYLSEEA